MEGDGDFSGAGFLGWDGDVDGAGATDGVGDFEGAVVVEVAHGAGEDGDEEHGGEGAEEGEREGVDGLCAAGVGGESAEAEGGECGDDGAEGDHTEEPTATGGVAVATRMMDVEVRAGVMASKTEEGDEKLE